MLKRDLPVLWRSKWRQKGDEERDALAVISPYPSAAGTVWGRWESSILSSVAFSFCESSTFSSSLILKESCNNLISGKISYINIATRAEISTQLSQHYGKLSLHPRPFYYHFLEFYHWTHCTANQFPAAQIQLEDVLSLVIIVHTVI